MLHFSRFNKSTPIFPQKRSKTAQNPICNKCNISPIVTLFRLSATSKCLKIRLLKILGGKCNIYPRKKIKGELDINILLIINTLRLLFFSCDFNFGQLLHVTLVTFFALTSVKQIPPSSLRICLKSYAKTCIKQESSFI